MRYLVIAGLLALSLSCKKKQKATSVAEHPVPSIPVQITVYPNDPLYFKIQSIGGWMYLDGGVNGLVVYRKSTEEFVALDRTSTALPDKPAARVLVQSDNFTLKDTISGSTWRIFDGTVTKGPAEWALRMYGTSYNGNSLRITN
jgi:hypothetical protein